MHYRMYYALYLFENESVSTCGELAGVLHGQSGQQSIMKYRFVNLLFLNYSCTFIVMSSSRL